MHHAAKTMRGGSRFHKYEENIMNANIDYLGLLTLLRRLLTLELISDSEAKKIAARGYGRGHCNFSLNFFPFGYGYFRTSMVLCVAEQGVTVE